MERGGVGGGGIVWMCVWMVGGGCMDVSVAVKG